MQGLTLWPPAEPSAPADGRSPDRDSPDTWCQRTRHGCNRHALGHASASSGHCGALAASSRASTASPPGIGSDQSPAQHALASYSQVRPVRGGAPHTTADWLLPVAHPHSTYPAGAARLRPLGWAPSSAHPTFFLRQPILLEAMAIALQPVTAEVLHQPVMVTGCPIFQGCPQRLAHRARTLAKTWVESVRCLLPARR